MAFRQEKCDRELLRVSLSFASVADKYTVTDEDSGDKTITDGIITLRFDALRTAKLLGVKKI